MRGNPVLGILMGNRSGQWCRIGLRVGLEQRYPPNEVMRHIHVCCAVDQDSFDF